MMTSSRLRNAGESFSNRRGHGSQLSISDPSHHVTEAIGTLYGDSDDDSGQDTRRETRPLSFVASPYGGEQLHKPLLFQRPHQLQALDGSVGIDEPSRIISRTVSDLTPTIDMLAPHENGGVRRSQTLPTNTPTEISISRLESLSPALQPPSPLSPTLSLRDVQSDSPGGSQFPLTNIDNPNDIAQELSNLQALRRMSMDVGNSADPDLVPFQGLSLMAMPSIAPSGEDDEGDISRLLWVPAKVHPELAPDQFKNFLEKRVQSIKRRSGDPLLTADSQHPRGDGGALSRKKSMLSRQVESKIVESRSGSNGDYDTTDIVDWGRQRRLSQTSAVQSAPELSLNELVSDPSKIVQRLTMDTQRQADGLERSSLEDDRPILPVATMGLRRSTRTTYRKGGSLRSGDHGPLSRRSAGTRQPRKDGDKGLGESIGPQHSLELHPSAPNLDSMGLEPVVPGNFSRPSRPTQRGNETIAQYGQAEIGGTAMQSTAMEYLEMTPATLSPQLHDAAPRPDLDGGPALSHELHLAQSESGSGQEAKAFPSRSSSQSKSYQGLSQDLLDTGLQQQQKQPQQHPPPKFSKRPSLARPAQPTTPTPLLAVDTATGHSLNETGQRPSVPGSSSTRTDNLTLIPTLPVDDRRVDRKPRDKDDSETVKSTGWKWFKSDEREKKKRGREKEDPARKGRSKPDRTQADKAHDGARLDVLQNSIDNQAIKGRESLLLDRDTFGGRPHEDKKADAVGRKVGDTKKEKDGFFGSIFGGSRRKESKDGGSSKGKQRIASPEPVSRLLRPDIDYPYTRFPIVEERAIYRMAHIKLANPRRDLRSQVLLSNFMYSYLAKVQAMHPQLNVPTSPHQKRQEEERKRREVELQQQQYLEQQMLARQEQQSQSNADQYNFGYHESDEQYIGHRQVTTDSGNIDYVDGAQIFEYDNGSHQGNDDHMGGSAHEHTERQQHSQQVLNQGIAAQDYNSTTANRNARGYYDYSQPVNSQQSDGDMW